MSDEREEHPWMDAHTPEVLATGTIKKKAFNKKEYQKAYNQQPKNREKKKEYMRNYMKTYRQPRKEQQPVVEFVDEIPKSREWREDASPIIVAISKFEPGQKARLNTSRYKSVTAAYTTLVKSIRKHEIKGKLHLRNKELYFEKM